MIKKWNIAILIFLTALLLAGCNLSTVSDLYCLPMRSEQYNNLQSVMNSAMIGLEFSAPINGDNQQTVQAADLDGDGEVEYLVFAKGTSEKPLQILVFSGDGENYQLLDIIESTGYAFDRVEYVQMDNDPGYEMVVGRQVSDQVVRSVSVYSLANGQMEQVMSANYSAFLRTDMDRNGKSELFILRPGDGVNGVAVLYSMNGNTLERSQEVAMSEPADNIMRLMLGKLNDGSDAVYVASAVSGGSGIITDVYTIIDGQLNNVSLSIESGTSVQTLRNYYVYADDIDSDGVLELPNLITMHRMEEDSSSSDQYIIRWFALTADGQAVDKRYTYHNYVGGWYVDLEGSVAHRITVVQKGSSYEFSIWNDDYTSTEKLMTIYVLTGQKREEQAVAENRFVLLRSESTVYAADLEVASAAYAMTKESLIASFHLILEDWKTGVT